MTLDALRVSLGRILTKLEDEEKRARQKHRRVSLRLIEGVTDLGSPGPSGTATNGGDYYVLRRRAVTRQGRTLRAPTSRSS
jgi:hypothetical protein